MTNDQEKDDSELDSEEDSELDFEERFSYWIGRNQRSIPSEPEYDLFESACSVISGACMIVATSALIGLVYICCDVDPSANYKTQKDGVQNIQQQTFEKPDETIDDRVMVPTPNFEQRKKN